MYTLKMIIQGDTHIRAEAEIRLSRLDGKGYNEAMDLVEESKKMQTITPDGTDYTGVCVQGVDIVAGHNRSHATEISAVEITTDCDVLDEHGLPMEMVLCAAREGTRVLDTAIGVVITSMDYGARYEFVYPGDQVYVVNSDGKTIETLR